VTPNSSATSWVIITLTLRSAQRCKSEYLYSRKRSSS
jgi:hypothetical protein